MNFGHIFRKKQLFKNEWKSKSFNEKLVIIQKYLIRINLLKIEIMEGHQKLVLKIRFLAFLRYWRFLWCSTCLSFENITIDKALINIHSWQRTTFQEYNQDMTAWEFPVCVEPMLLTPDHNSVTRHLPGD